MSGNQVVQRAKFDEFSDEVLPIISLTSGNISKIWSRLGLSRFFAKTTGKEMRDVFGFGSKNIAKKLSRHTT